MVDPIWVNFSISDNDLLKARQEKAKKQIVFPKDNQFQIEAILADGSVVPSEGFIDFTNPALQQSTGTLLIRAVLPNPNLLIYPGQFVRAVVKGAIRPNAILVPQTAIIQGASGAFVYVVENGKAVARPVTTGDWYKDYWIIFDGLKAGDIVITQGVNKVTNGRSVAITSLIPSRYCAQSCCVNFCGHHNDPDFDDPSSAILRQYGSPHDHRNLDHSEDHQNSQNLTDPSIVQ